VPNKWVKKDNFEYCYLHQSEAIEHLLSNNATSVVVTHKQEVVKKSFKFEYIEKI